MGVEKTLLVQSGPGHALQTTSWDHTGPSWQSRVIVGLLRLLPIKKRMASATAVQEHVRRLALRPASFEPTGLGRGVEVTRKDVAGWPVYHTAPSGRSDVGNIVVFLHGGGYIKEIVRAHWRFVGYLTRSAHRRFGFCRAAAISPCSSPTSSCPT